jgi:hypothetical protein
MINKMRVNMFKLKSALALKMKIKVALSSKRSSILLKMTLKCRLKLNKFHLGREKVSASKEKIKLVFTRSSRIH